MIPDKVLWAAEVELLDVINSDRIVREVVKVVAPIIAAAEREECARIAERCAPEDDSPLADGAGGSGHEISTRDVVLFIANHIRARGDKP